MVVKECNSRAGVYKVQTFGTTQPAPGSELASDPPAAPGCHPQRSREGECLCVTG